MNNKTLKQGSLGFYKPGACWHPGVAGGWREPALQRRGFRSSFEDDSINFGSPNNTPGLPEETMQAGLLNPRVGGALSAWITGTLKS